MRHDSQNCNISFFQNTPGRKGLKIFTRIGDLLSYIVETLNSINISMYIYIGT